MNRRLLALAFFCLAAAGCRGSSPEVYGSPEQGISAVIIGCHITLPTGETQSGRLFINLESESEKGLEPDVYRLKIKPDEALIYQVEPGVYHLTPPRAVFGEHEAELTVEIEGRSHRVPFPREILRKPAIVIKPTKIVPIGVMNVTLVGSLPGREPTLKVALDDSVLARRKLIQDLIHKMVDPNAPASVRNSAVSWTQALDQSLLDLLSETQRAPLYKPAP